jgi:hypothetical protein
MAAIVSVVALSSAPASGADRTGSTVAQTRIALASASCTITSGNRCQSASIPANPTTHSIDYNSPAHICYRLMQIRDASNHAIVKSRGIPGGYPAFGRVPGPGDAPGGLWGSYYVTLSGCGGSVTISN